MDPASGGRRPPRATTSGGSGPACHLSALRRSADPRRRRHRLARGARLPAWRVGGRCPAHLLRCRAPRPVDPALAELRLPLRPWRQSTATPTSSRSRPTWRAAASRGPGKEEATTTGTRLGEAEPGPAKEVSTPSKQGVSSPRRPGEMHSSSGRRTRTLDGRADAAVASGDAAHDDLRAGSDGAHRCATSRGRRPSAAHARRRGDRDARAAEAGSGTRGSSRTSSGRRPFMERGARRDRDLRPRRVHGTSLPAPDTSSPTTFATLIQGCDRGDAQRGDAVIVAARRSTPCDAPTRPKVLRCSSTASPDVRRERVADERGLRAGRRANRTSRSRSRTRPGAAS